jgi:tetratricopeptide (TPR) repeat protein
MFARLDESRPAEQNTADLSDGWAILESALRGLVPGSASLSGQALIRELRQGELIPLPLAYALVACLAARDRAARSGYSPTAGDLDAARHAYHDAYDTLSAPEMPPAGGAGGFVSEHAHGDGDAATAAAAWPRSGPVAASSAEASSDSAESEASAPRRRTMRVGGIVIALCVGIALTVWAVARRGSPAELRRGTELLALGRREGAREQFERAAATHPGLAMPHVYLGRMAREEHDFPRAQRELQTATTLEPGNAVALREFASLFLAAGNLDMARTFYVHALERDQRDLVARGFLGCTLIRLGRMDEGMRWLDQAGPGDWSVCTSLKPDIKPGLKTGG